MSRPAALAPTGNGEVGVGVAKLDTRPAGLPQHGAHLTGPGQQLTVVVDEVPRMSMKLLAGLSFTMLMSLFLVMSLGTSVMGNQPSKPAKEDIPRQLLPIYRAAADTCPGLPWSVLAAIGKLESDHGRSTGPGVTSGTSPAGAAGPMQIGIGGEAGNTFADYAVDGTGDGVADAYNPTDAIFTAANYLCRNGAQGGADLRQAISAYHHDDGYVKKVRQIASSYAALARSPTVRPTSPPVGKFVGPNTPSYQKLTPTAKRLYATVVQTFRVTSIGGWRAVGSVEGSDHPYGRAIDVMISYPSAQGRVLGWRIAKWAVAKAEAFDVKYVIFNGRIWTRSQGWHGYRHPSDACNCNPTLRHDDHVHISVRH
jgi:Transglycosylase SLT domain